MAEALVQVLVDNLSSLVQNRIGSYMGEEDEINKLFETLITIQAVLEDAEDKQLKSKPIQNWLRKLKDLAYEIDDVLDDSATEASKLQNPNGIFNFTKLKKIFNRFKIGSRMREVTDRLNALTTESLQFGLQTWDKERQSKAAATRETSSVVIEPELVCGRDEEKEKIVDILVNHVKDSQHLSILPIIGIGGLGKTTLAQLVYNHPRVNEHFEKKLWVCVSDNFVTKTLVKAIIESTSGSRSSSDNLDTLQLRLQELLNQKKYLLILDDVWNEDQEEWAKLKSVLACGSSGASIVVTTRMRKVADIMGTLPSHELSTLSEEHCWSLFRQRAFGQEMGKHPNLEAIGMEIVKKCGGVPLAAKALGGLLRFKRKENEWVYVNESEIWNLPQEEALILPSLRLSYQHLPLQLRQCFAYCAVYPKDHEMEKEEVIYCWIAHGYISSKERRDVEGVGDDVWNELVLRSLFQDVSINPYGGRVVRFKMHDLVHDLAQSIMENKVPGAEVDSIDRGAPNRNKIRQVNVQKRYLANVSYTIKVNIYYTSINNFNRLRVLDASWADVEDLPREIDKLKHLRYLNMSGSNHRLRTLPDRVCSLWNLQILNLNNCSSLEELPKRMRYMKNLCHLLLDGCNSLRNMPPNIGELTSLKTLTIFIVGYKRGRRLDELQNLNLGGNLEIKHLERVKNYLDAMKANMGNKSNLRDLVLQWEEGENASEQQQKLDEKVLEALEPHPNLENLQIYGFKGRYFPTWTRMGNLTEIRVGNFPNCSRLPPLGYLPRLKFLCLSNLAALEYVMENEVQGGDGVKDAILFPSLEKLELDSMPNLKGLLKHEVQGGGMPRLKLMSLTNLYSLEYVMENEVEGGDHVKDAILFPSLEKLELWSLPNLKGLLKLEVQGGGMPRLKSLVLRNLASLEYVMKNEVDGGNQVKDAILFPSLEELKLYDLPNLKGLLKHEDEVGQIFPNLQKLVIRDSPILILPQPSSLKELTADNCSSLNLNSMSKLDSLTSLELIFHNDMRTCITKEALENLSNLKKLILNNAKEHDLPIEDDGLQGLKSLTELEIKNCDTLTCLPDVWLRHLAALEILSIDSCKEFVELLLPIEGMKYHHLKRLRLHYLPKMVYLQEVLQHLIPSLQSLHLSHLPQLTSLPDWLGNFTSLEHLYIMKCPRVTSLPASIKGMTNLKRLETYGCPELEKRYEKEKGKDWHIVAHIAYVWLS